MKAKFLFIVSTLLLEGCSPMIDDSNSENTTTSIDEGEKVEFTPLEGEVRQWFEHGKIGDDKYYNYCPSTIVENGIKHIFYCSNKMYGNVTDYIAYRQGVYENGHFKYTDTKDIIWALSPTASTWDERHVCDPSVIKGEFNYDGTKYSYLMAYLGCITSDNTRNETGLAVSNSLEGPWIKCDKINPIVPVESDNYHWGNGQPELISVDKKGRAILFTSYSGNSRSGEQCFEYDFSDLNNPKLIRSKLGLNTNGISNVNKKEGEKVSNFIANVGIAYDEVNKKIIMAKGRNPFGSDGLAPNFIASQVDVYYLDDSNNENAFDELFKSSASANNWVFIGTIDEQLTSFKRNHNTGIVRDPYGRLVESDRVEVAFTRSDADDFTNAWGYWSTYRIYSTSFNLSYIK